MQTNDYRLNSIKFTMVKMLYTFGFFIMALLPLFEEAKSIGKFSQMGDDTYKKIVFCLSFFASVFLAIYLQIKITIRKKYKIKLENKQMYYYLLFAIASGFSYVIYLLISLIFLYQKLRVGIFISFYVFATVLLIISNIFEFLNKIYSVKIINDNSEILNDDLVSDKKESLIIKKEVSYISVEKKDENGEEEVIIKK